MRINRTTIGGLLIGASVIMGVLVLWPMYQNLVILQGEIESKQRALMNKEAYTEKLALLERELKNYPTEMEKIEAAIPENRGIPALFHFIQGMTARSGLVLRSIAASESENVFAGSDIVVTRISIGTSGSYAALKEFLTRARTSAEMVEVTFLSFSSPDLLTEEFGYTINLQVYSF